MSAPIVLALRLITALALYGFLGWALYVLWRDIQKQGFALANRRAPSISLTIRQGKTASALKHFTQPEVTLGRDPRCDVPLNDDTASTRHAHLTYHHGQWWLEDLASTNGTMLNETMVNMPTVITSGDEIQCGAAHLIVTLSPDAPVSPTQKLERKE
ncbi:MAG: FHA domain-containing protein [Anaerolineales bacterium]|nr:FHA domain-containing protein [Anaerolineales bacterium]